jgi:hypothetical protein
MSKMRMHTVTWLLLIAAIYGAGDWLGSTALSSLIWHGELPFPKMYGGRYDAEVVCIGNSRGVHGFPEKIMEEVTGKRTANISVNGLTPQITECVLLDYLDRCPAPKIVLAEASFIEKETTAAGIIKLSPYFSKSQRLFDLACQFDPTYAFVSRISKLMQYNSEVTTRAAMLLLIPSSEGVVRKQLPPHFIAETEEMTPLELRIDKAEAEAVRRMADECRKRGIDFKLVLTGYLPAYREKIANLQEWQDQIEKVTGVEVVDLSDIPENSAFFDRIHLNAEGSRHTAEMIVEQGLLN